VAAVAGHQVQVGWAEEAGHPEAGVEAFLVEAEVLVEAEAAEAGNHFNHELEFENFKLGINLSTCRIKIPVNS